MVKVFLNGQVVEMDQARLSPLDAGLQHGVGLFETMRAYGGQVFRLEAHLARLVASARDLGLTDRLQERALAQAVEATLQANEMKEARIRLTVTGGDLSLLQQAPGRGPATPARHDPTILITCSAPTPYPEGFFTKGVMALVADPKVNNLDPGAGHKTLNYWGRLKSLALAATAGAGESLWFTMTNHLCGGAVSNAFLVKEGRLLTPQARGEEPPGAIPSPVLPGITRGLVLEITERLNVDVERRLLTIQDVLGADELFLTNTGWGILPVVQVEKHTIGPGKPGPVTDRLREELNRIIEEECGV